MSRADDERERGRQLAKVGGRRDARLARAKAAYIRKKKEIEADYMADKVKIYEAKPVKRVRS
jgi:hypothetical protein